MKAQQHSNGFILPATILLSLAIAIIAATFMQYVANASVTLNKQTYTNLAQEAADAGIAYAVSCLEQSANPLNWGGSGLAPNTDCSGTVADSISPNVAGAANGQWQSTFTVPNATLINSTLKEEQVVANGTVKFYANGIQVGTVTVSRNVTVVTSFNTVNISQGNSLTALESDTHSCAIANGQLYCWGDNSKGQLGTGDKVDKSVPTAIATGVGQIFYNKTITKVAVGTGNTCAIADGQLYCWGDNTYGQLGIGTTANTSANYSPQLVAAGSGQAFSNKKITSISLSQSAYTNKSACAVANGVVYCWGSNLTQQIGQSTPSTKDTTTLYSSPQRVYGYNSGDTSSLLYGKKTQSVAIGTANACASTAGTVYCWGQVSQTPKAVSSTDTIDPLSLKSIGGDKMCAIGAGQIDCGDGGGTLSIQDSWAGSDPPSGGSGAVDAFDGANKTTDPADSGSWTICAFDGRGKDVLCHGTGLNSAPQSSGTGGTEGRGATAVGVGGIGNSRYGCGVFNGGLACWGSEKQGQLAIGTATGSSSKTTWTTAMASGFGTNNAPDGSTGQYPFKVAATGQISAGANHECMVADMNALCWGSNSNGQIGTGDTADQNLPTIIVPEAPSICVGFYPICFGHISIPSAVEQIVAGGNHTCALVDHQHNAGFGSYPVSTVDCWGDNAYGQLGGGTGGAGNYSESHTPKLAFSGTNRITNISTGPRDTCAVSYFQLYCWGDNTYGQLGQNPGSLSKTDTPQLISLPGQVTSVSVGTTHICAISSGNSYCWGDNSTGQLGTGSSTPSSTYTPQQVTAGVAGATDGNTTAAFTDIAAGNGYTCAIINGSVACWGKNTVGQTGSGTSTPLPVYSPTAISGTPGSMQANAISAGDSHACAVLQGAVYCWGDATGGDIGDSSTSGIKAPTLINGGDIAVGAPPANASVNVAAGGDVSSGGTSCSVTNANIYCWGIGTSGQIGNGNTYTILSPFQSTPSQSPRYRSVGSATIGAIY